MSELFIELYLDEDVSVLIAELIRARGFTAVTTREAKQLANDDSEQLAYAASQRKAIVTHNRTDIEDMAKQYFETDQEHYGIIIAVRRSPYEIARRLLRILNQVTADEMQNQIRYI